MGKKGGAAMKKILPVIFILILINCRAEADLPGLTVSQSGRYLKTTEGQPFFMVGRQINYTWGNFWQLYEQNKSTEVEKYLAGLSSRGINTLRMFCEDLFPGHDYYMESDIKTGALNIQAENFLKKIIELGEKYGIYFILSPWDTMYMGDGSAWYDRWLSNPYYTNGIINSPADFYRTDNPNGLNDMQKNRLSSLLKLIGNHRNVIIEIINEVDGRWQMPYIFSNEYGAPWRATWFPQVVQPWLEMMRDYVRNSGFSGPLTFSTSVEYPALDEEHDFLFRLPGFDLFLYHPYYLDQSACINWPCNLLRDWPDYAVFCQHGVRCTGDPGKCSQGLNGCDGEHTVIQPARDMRDAARFARMFGNRPYVSGEDGPLFHSSYSSDFSKNDDIETFCNQQWANVAAGAASSGIRHPQGVLGENNSLLWQEMDDIQGTIANFFTKGSLIDLNTFEAVPIDDYISVNNNAVVKMGVKDEQNQSAIIFLLADKWIIPDGQLGGTDFSIAGLTPAKTYRVEKWETTGFHTSPDWISDVTTGPDGSLTFFHDLRTSAVFKITTRQADRSAASEITASLDIGATIHTEEKGPILSFWKEGGRSATSRGDVVVWGHLYAPPEEVSWGDADNPDAFVKIWFDVSGRIDVNFFHVSVPDLNVASAYNSNNIWTAAGDIRMGDRYIRHEYHGSIPSVTNCSGTGIRNEDGYDITDTLKINAVFYPNTPESFAAAWREGGRATTNRGDKVIWGFFYADPVDRDWGNPENPDVFVKIWYDISGRVDVNYFHVSVPDIVVKSTFSGTDATNSVTMEERYIRHEFAL
jgi:hypothetical protein